MQKQALKVNQNGSNSNSTRSKVYDREHLKQQLTPLQFRVTQDKITERPFTGEYVKLTESGMYACVVCGEHLFSSSCKYDSGCGWPAFYDVAQGGKVKLSIDMSHVGNNLLLLAKQDCVRTEVTCASCGAHLGHVFDDGPKPTGKRYCVNSASLQFYRSENVNATPNHDNKHEKDDKAVIQTSVCTININGSANHVNNSDKTDSKPSTKLKRTFLETHL